MLEGIKASEYTTLSQVAIAMLFIFMGSYAT